MRDTATRKADALAALEKQHDIWLATADVAGRPHIIAVSAWWDGTDLVVIPGPLGHRHRERDLHY